MNKAIKSKFVITQPRINLIVEVFIEAYELNISIDFPSEIKEELSNQFYIAGNNFIKEGNYTEAVKRINLAFTANQLDHIAPERKNELAYQFVEQAYRSITLRNYTEAESLIKLALTINPSVYITRKQKNRIAEEFFRAANDFINQGKCIEAVKLLEISVNFNHLPSCAALANILAYGREGVPKNKAKAFRLVVDKEDNDCKGILAMCGLNAIGCSPDRIKVESIYQLTSESYVAGSKYGAYMMGIIHIRGCCDIEKNEAKAIDYFMEAYGRYHDLSAYELGEIYRIRNDIALSIQYFERAKNQGVIDAIYKLGKIFVNKKKNPEAILLFERAKNSGDEDIAELSEIELVKLGIPYDKLDLVTVKDNDAFVFDISNINRKEVTTIISDVFLRLKDRINMQGIAIGSKDVDRTRIKFANSFSDAGFDTQLYDREKEGDKEKSVVDISISAAIGKIVMKLLKSSKSSKSSNTLFIFSGDGNTGLDGIDGENKLSIYETVETAVETGIDVVVVGSLKNTISKKYNKLSRYPNFKVLSFIDFLKSVIEPPFNVAPLPHHIVAPPPPHPIVAPPPIVGAPILPPGANVKTGKIIYVARKQGGIKFVDGTKETFFLKNALDDWSNYEPNKRANCIFEGNKLISINLIGGDSDYKKKYLKYKNKYIQLKLNLQH